MNILAINPGSTSTKVAVFTDGEMLFSENITYSEDSFQDAAAVMDQLEIRHDDIEKILQEHYPNMRFDAVVGRGGPVGPVPPGGYVVDDEFIEVVTHRPVLQHASILGGPLAREVSRAAGTAECLALIYDPVTIDEMSDVARITGVPGVLRQSIGHHLNMRAVARRVAEKLGKPYDEARMVVLHIGGGSSACAISGGHVVDLISDDEVQFSAERSGGLPVKELLRLVKNMSIDEANIQLRQRSGLAGLLGTTDLREVEKRMADGDEYAALVFDAMALQISKAIAALAVSLDGKVDALAITGGMAHSDQLVSAVQKRTAHIAQLIPYPGEFEMVALEQGARRILSGSEPAQRVGDFLSPSS